MPEVVVKYKGQKALKALRDVAKAFDMEIELPASKEELPNPEKYKYLPIQFAENPDFTVLAGIWKDRDITQEELRKKAWGNRL
jgi:hypothetical protein